jgi:hypothetical protein
MVRPLQNAQILAFWFSEWKVMTVWRYFFGQFLIKNRVKFKKLFLEIFKPWILNISKRIPAKLKKKIKNLVTFLLATYRPLNATKR